MKEEKNAEISPAVRLSLVHEMKIFNITSDISEISERIFGY